ncbi:hypothetical protein [Enhygromyxa salina]|uniref:Uncharacterized protein n=1 Tax=Enhygromyxa salina TaxID=215803 RepID=A0A2S9XUR7_9BACT|nr:hypothetical protein [Enhygromyxa salina]PRP96480.1 hypothetical protein ENSA7_72950 [Enhygromyxa salina]
MAESSPPPGSPPHKRTPAQRAARALIKGILPRPSRSSRFVRYSLYAFVIAFAILVSAASLPVVGRWLRDHTIGPLPANPSLGLSLEGIANAIDFLGVLFIGGAVFSSQMAKFVQDRAIDYEHAMTTAFGVDSYEISTEIDASIARIDGLIERAAWAGFGRTVWDGWKEARRLYFMIFDLPGHYGRYAWTMVVTRFPGGFFGLLAFLTFGSSAALKTAKLWVDMGPS